MTDINGLIEKSIEGDSESKEELLFRLKPLILSSIKKYYNKYDLYEDLIQEGYEVILNNIMDFDKKKGVHFLGFVKTQLRYYFLDKHKKDRAVISLNKPINKVDGNIELMDMIADDRPIQEDILIHKFETQSLWESFLKLSERQQQVITLYYLEGKSITKVGEILGIRYRTVVNTKVRALEKLKDFLEKDSKK